MVYVVFEALEKRQYLMVFGKCYDLYKSVTNVGCIMHFSVSYTFIRIKEARSYFFSERYWNRKGRILINVYVNAAV